MPSFVKVAGILWLALAPFASRALALSQVETDQLVKLVDERQRNSGDYKSTVYLEQKEKDKNTQVFEAIVFRRDADAKWMLIFTKPKAEAGKGYLRLDKNLFLYEPAVGKWERRTERTQIGGTNSQRQDFDESRLAEEYVAVFVGDEKLGKFDVSHVKLTAKPDVDIASPVVHLWVDKDSKNVLKRQEHALSDKLLRTVYYPQWEKMFSKSKGAEVYVPKEIRIIDEVEKGNSTTVALKEVSLDPLDANLFTKAWIESQSR